MNIRIPRGRQSPARALPPTVPALTEVGLSTEMARKIVLEETRVALLRSKLAWLVLLFAVALTGFLYSLGGANRISAFCC